MKFILTTDDLLGKHTENAPMTAAEIVSFVRIVLSVAESNAELFVGHNPQIGIKFDSSE